MSSEVPWSLSPHELIHGRQCQGGACSVLAASGMARSRAPLETRRNFAKRSALITGPRGSQPGPRRNSATPRSKNTRVPEYTAIPGTVEHGEHPRSRESCRAFCSPADEHRPHHEALPNDGEHAIHRESQPPHDTSDPDPCPGFYPCAAATPRARGRNPAHRCSRGC